MEKKAHIDSAGPTCDLKMIGLISKPWSQPQTLQAVLAIRWKQLVHIFWKKGATWNVSFYRNI